LKSPPKAESTHHTKPSDYLPVDGRCERPEVVLRTTLCRWSYSGSFTRVRAWADLGNSRTLRGFQASWKTASQAGSGPHSVGSKGPPPGADHNNQPKRANKKRLAARDEVVFVVPPKFCGAAQPKRQTRPTLKRRNVSWTPPLTEGSAVELWE